MQIATFQPVAGVLAALMVVASACSTAARDAAPGGTPSTSPFASTPVVTKYIGNTAGQGVRLRTECRDGATTEGVLADQFEVRVDAIGAGACDGWTRVHSGTIVSWVRNTYLLDSLAAAGGGGLSAVSSAPAPASGGAAVAGGSVASAAVANATPAPSTFAFVATGGARVTLTELDGAATLWGGPAQLVYLGLLASAPFPDSVCNASGRYGSADGTDSVRNRGGQYANQTSEFSAYNPAAEAPPVIKLRNARVASLSRGVGGRGVVDPDALLNALCR